MSVLEIAQLLGSVGEVVGGLAVVATLVYMGAQVRYAREAVDTNTRATEESRAQAKLLSEANWMTTWNELVSRVFDTKENVSLMCRGLAAPDALNEDEYMQFTFRLILVVNHHFVALHLFRQGMRDADAFEKMNDWLVMLLESPGGRIWWSKAGYVFAHHDYVNELLARGKPRMNFTEWQRHLVG
jgi:hypothetical protein